MKDTIVTARRKKIELITLLVCFVVSNLYGAQNETYIED